MNWKELLKSKTIKAAMAGVIVEVLGLYGAISPELVNAIETVIAFIALAFLRAGVEKTKPKE